MPSFRTSCRLCFNGCGVIAHVKDGRVESLSGDPDHPISKGVLCKRGRAALEQLEHPNRLRRPLKRKGPRGSGEWTPIDWDEALNAIARGLEDTAGKWGRQAVAFMRGGSKGTSDDLLTRLANIFGSPNVSTTSSICYSAASLASKHTYGFMAYPDLDGDTRCVVLWGFNPKATHHPLYAAVHRAVSAGARLVVIDPCAQPGGQDLTLRPRPGTDGLLALAMAHCLLDENLHDERFTAQWTTGLARLRAHLAPYAPESVQERTWVPADAIREAARLYATAKPGCILWGNALEDGRNNYQTCRAVCVLRALTGNLGAPGGDVMWSDHAEMRRRDPALTRPDLLPPAMAEKRLGALAGLLPDFYYAPHNLVARAVLEDDPYPVRAAYLQGGNLLCTSADARIMADALKKLEFFAATDHFMTPTTALADVVLPASMYLEENAVEQPWQWPVAAAVNRVADPGLTRSEGRIANDLAKRFAGGMYAFGEMSDFLEFYLEPSGMGLDAFRTAGSILAEPQPMAHEERGFPTPSGKVELYSDFLAGAGFDSLPTVHDPDPVDGQHPFVLTSRKSPIFYHSCGRQTGSLRGAQPEPTVRLHPETANTLGLAQGDMARITTPKGAIRQRVTLDEALDPRLVVADHGWWFPELGAKRDFGAYEANLNLLTDAYGLLGRELGSATLRGLGCRVEPETPPKAQGEES